MPTLTWTGKEDALRAASLVPFRLLEPHQALEGGSFGDPESALENLLIQGDNLEALKALLPYYAGRVKCIYIDPPYNTGSAFEHYDDNLEHSTWLSMMYPRLELLRELLMEDGSIWVSADDSEAHYLKAMMDEVFGRGNFLSTFVWKKSYGGGSKSRWFVGLHEFILCYAKDINSFPDMWLPPDPDAVKKYYKYSDDKVTIRGPYNQPLATTSMDERPNLRYPIVLPDGREVWPEKQWQWSKDRALEALTNDELVITERRGKVTISYKQYLRDTDGEERKRKPTTIIDGYFTQHGTYEGMDLFGLENKFAFPKPEGLIRYIFEATTRPGDIVLDSFLGSGTTAAVAHKMGRHWIGIEMGDHAVTHCLPRLKKVIDGEQGGISQAIGWKGGGGFRFAKLGETLFDAFGRLNPKVKFADLAAFVWWRKTNAPAFGGSVNTASPLLGIHEGRGIYLLYNGILGDKRPAGGNVLTSAVLASLPKHAGERIIYADSASASASSRGCPP